MKVDAPMAGENELLALIYTQSGHFVYESGYHSDVWWYLEALCHRPKALLPFVADLAAQVLAYRPEVICGALVEGAFLALLAAAEIGCDFAYALRIPSEDKHLFPIRYELPAALRPVVQNKRVVVINDVISAGSAVRGAIQQLQQLGATVTGVGSLFLLGETFAEYCQSQNLPLIALFRREHHLWLPEACPLCEAGVSAVCLADH